MSNQLQRVLIVGGPFDGTWRLVDAAYTAILPIDHASPASAEYRPGEEEAAVSLTRYIYRRTEWNVQSEHNKPAVYRFVYVLDLKVDQLFDRLLESYRPTADARITALERQVRALQEALERANMMGRTVMERL
jgi:hypothetical protein